MLKSNELRDPNSCLNKAAGDEPIFVLRARDPLAAATIRLWASMAAGVHEPKKIADAFGAAETTDAWHKKNGKVIATESGAPKPPSKARGPNKPKAPPFDPAEHGGDGGL